MKKAFGLRGVSYLLTRFAGSILRGPAFDRCYQSGRWAYFDYDHNPEMVKVVGKYASKGHILDMGCGPRILASLLDPDAFEYYRGVDVSSEAFALAQKRKNEKIHFEIGDIQSYECKDTFDLIVFEESLYYVPFGRYRLLKRHARNLRPGGTFIVTVAEPRRFSRMIRMIRRKFRVLEDRCFENYKRWLLVFLGDGE